MLLAGLTSGFHDLIRADDSIPSNVQDQIVDGSQDGVPMISEAQAESIAKKGGLSADQTKNVVDHYSDAQIEALKKACSQRPRSRSLHCGSRATCPERRSRRGDPRLPAGGRETRIRWPKPRKPPVTEDRRDHRDHPLGAGEHRAPDESRGRRCAAVQPARRGDVIIYTAAGLTFTIAVGLLIIGAFQGVDINSGTDRTKGIAEIASGIVALASRWAC